MFVRMLVRAAVLRRGRVASALFAMVVAAAVATAMLNLYVDVQAKLRREFRNYGANIILVGKDGASLPARRSGAGGICARGPWRVWRLSRWWWREPAMASRLLWRERISIGCGNSIAGGR